MTDPDDFPTDDGIPAPPAGWLYIGHYPPVILNLDRSINEQVAGQLREGGLLAAHASLQHHGVVWFAAGKWHERVAVAGKAVAAYSSDTLPELMRIVNDEYGWS